MRIEVRPRIDLRTAHPNLYKAITTFALISLGLGLNFLLIKPAFNQYHLSKIMAVVFVVIGVAQLVFLNVVHRLPLLRLAMAAGVSSLFFYGGALTTYYFQTHSTSLQLPITYFGLSILQFALLIEPPTNPVSEKNGNGRPAG
jgi:hypothetical protein